MSDVPPEGRCERTGERFGTARWLLFLATLAAAEAGLIAWLWTRLPAGGALGGAGGIFHRPDPNLIREVYPEVDFTKVYPDLPPERIDELQRRCWGLRYGYEPFVEFRPLAVEHELVGVSPQGFRRGRPPAEPWPPRASDFVVFVFGGSTTFGYGLPGDQTVVQYLEDELAARLGRARGSQSARRVEAYNFGRGYYFSTQERILFEQHLLEGRRPDLAVFLDGLNDFYYWDGVPEYTVNLARSVAPDLPFEGRPTLERSQHPAAAERVLARYSGNLRLIEAAADAHGVPVCFVGQPVPFLHYPLGPDTFPYRRPFGGHALCISSYGAFEQAALAGRFGPRFLWCGDVFAGAETFHYVDFVHYAAVGASKLAHAIVERAAERGLLPLD